MKIGMGVIMSHLLVSVALTGPTEIVSDSEVRLHVELLQGHFR